MLGSMLGRYENSVTLSLIDIRMPGSSNNNPPKEEDDSPEFCFLKISIAGQVRKQSVVLQLNVKDCPKTCRNFSALCSSSKTTSATQPLPSYRGCDFHRIIDGFMVQSGDFEHFNGTGGFSPLYQVFDDEYLNGKHDQAGILSMANTGRNTNKSQFFITLKQQPHLNGKHVAFGKVISGMDTILAMVSVEREGDRPVPMQRIQIYDCGIGKGTTRNESEDGDYTRTKTKRRRKKSRRKDRKKHSKKKRRSSSSVDETSSSDDDARKESPRHRRRQKKNKKQRKRSSISSSEDDDSYSLEVERRRQKRRQRRRYSSSSSDEDSSYEKRRNDKTHHPKTNR